MVYYNTVQYSILKQRHSPPETEHSSTPYFSILKRDKSMSIKAFPSMVGREREWERLVAFAADDTSNATLGIVWGRRRVGKSLMLETLVSETQGFYHHAIRGSSGEALRGLAEDIARHLKLPAPLALESWEQAMAALVALGRDRAVVVVLDEFPYLLEHTPELESIIQRLYGPLQASRTNTRTRLILCGSAVSVMSKLLTGTAPLRGRAGLDLRVAPFDFRVARTLHAIDDLPTAVATYAVIGGVAAYAREMSGNDLPRAASDFDRWICERVLSPAAPLFGEIDLMLGEDPTTSRARKLNLYHAVLAAVAQGHHAWSSICNYVKTGSSSLQAVMNTLVASELVVRMQDPIRGNRPVYQARDPLLRFHYAIIRRHQPRLARMAADTSALWQELMPTYRSLVLGPSFEAMAREWTTHMAAPQTIGGAPDHVGASVLGSSGTTQQELDIVVAADDGGDDPEKRTVHALGEAKVAETLTMQHVRRLEAARARLGARASNSRLLLFGNVFDQEIRAESRRRSDLELIDLERLYAGT